MLQPTEPTAPTPAPAQGLLEYATRCHNFWLYRYHTELPAPAADLYHLLLFLWMQQGRPAVVLAHQPDLLQRLGFTSPKTLRTAQAPLLAQGLLAKAVAGVKGKPGQYYLGPEPGQLMPNNSRQILPTMLEAPQDSRQILPSIPAADNIVGKIYPESGNILGNNSPTFLPTIPDSGQNLPSIILEAAEPEVLADARQILPSISGEYVLSNTGSKSLDLLNLADAKPTPPTPPPTKRRRTPAETHAERLAQNEAAAATFAQFLELYQGANTENPKAWGYWQKLTPSDWAAALAYLPDYVKYTQGERIRWRLGNATFVYQKTWLHPDKITRLKASYEADLAAAAKKAQPKTNVHTQRSVTEAARRNAPAYKPGQGGSL